MKIVDDDACCLAAAPERPIRVMVVDDQEVIRVGITALLARCDDLAVVAAVGSAVEALEACGRLDVDVVLMDLSMPETDGVRAIALLVDRNPDLRVVVLMVFVAEAPVRAAVDAGATACLLKTAGAEELAQAIRGATQGRSTFSSELLPYLVGNAGEATPGTSLTPREHDILTLLADGSTNRGIAEALGLAEGTVRVYVSAILAKLGVANRTEATLVAIRDGLVEKPDPGATPPRRQRR